MEKEEGNNKIREADYCKITGIWKVIGSKIEVMTEVLKSGGYMVCILSVSLMIHKLRSDPSDG